MRKGIYRSKGERYACLVCEVFSLAEALVTLASFGYFAPDWRAQWLFSDRCQEMMERKK